MYNFDNWSYSDLVTFAKSMEQGDMEQAVMLVNKAYSGSDDLGDPQDWNMEEADKRTHEVMVELNAAIEKGSVTDCKVSLFKWSVRRMNEFRKAQKDGKAALVEAMLHEVVEMKGVKKDAPLTALQASLMMRALFERHGKLLSGKA